MSISTTDNKGFLHPLLKFAMVLCLISAAWHVASHELSAVNSSDDCQLCRLNHVASGEADSAVLLEPVALLFIILSIRLLLSPVQRPRFKSGARAPPITD